MAIGFASAASLWLFNRWLERQPKGGSGAGGFRLAAGSHVAEPLPPAASR